MYFGYAGRVENRSTFGRYQYLQITCFDSKSDCTSCLNKRGPQLAYFDKGRVFNVSTINCVGCDKGGIMRP